MYYSNMDTSIFLFFPNTNTFSFNNFIMADSTILLAD
jgi:hypothetical protein